MTVRLSMKGSLLAVALAFGWALPVGGPSAAAAQEFGQCGAALEAFTPDPAFTSEFFLDECPDTRNRFGSARSRRCPSRFTTVGTNPYFPLRPGWQLVLASDEAVLKVSVLDEVEWVDGVRTRVVEEREWEIDEEGGLGLVEVSRNFFVHDRLTGAVYYLGEDSVDGEGTPLAGSWRSGEGAQGGLIMPGTILLGGRYYQEIAPADEALDKGEILTLEPSCEVGEFTFEHCVTVADTSDCDPDELSIKVYARGVGIVVDDDAEVRCFGRDGACDPFLCETYGEGCPDQD
ncbi:MAG: hypothetical protein Kow0092_32810 [Deferrisomatales bacterium]